jgi:hypothetical protein
MDTTALLASIDAEIARLEEVKRLLSNSGGVKRGRKPGIATAFTFGANRPRKRRKLSAKAVAAIRSAQAKRWAEWHKTHPKK